jgi:hypothetical protein
MQDKDLEKAEQMLTPEDLAGGFHNVDPPADFYEEQDAKAEEALKFIEMNDTETDVPHRSDKVRVALSPEQLVILTEILEKYSTQMRGLDYAYDELKIESLYEQAALVREIREEVNETLHEYVRVRPYTPFILPWFNRIGKDKVRKGKE